METTKLTHNEAVNDRVVRFVADLMVKIVSSEVSTAQAVQSVNKFADSLRGKVPDDQISDARAYMTDYVFAAQASMQRQGAGSGKASRKPYSEMTLDELVEIAVQNRKAGRPRDKEADKWFEIRHEEKYGPVQIKWIDNPANLGLTIPWTPDPNNPPMDAIDHLWESIKARLPPHMIDTPDKCKAMAKHIGFLIGFWGERSVYRILRTFGILP